MQLQSTDYMIPELDPNFLDGSLGIDEGSLRDIGENLAEGGSPASDLAAALSPFSGADQQTIIASFLAFGGDPAKVARATQLIEKAAFVDDPMGLGKNRKLRIAWAVLGTASMAASAFHGYRRNQSIGWALVWGLMGGAFPVFTPVVALAQGFGQRK